MNLAGVTAALEVMHRFERFTGFFDRAKLQAVLAAHATEAAELGVVMAAGAAALEAARAELSAVAPAFEAWFRADPTAAGVLAATITGSEAEGAAGCLRTCMEWLEHVEAAFNELHVELVQHVAGVNVGGAASVGKA